MNFSYFCDMIFRTELKIQPFAHRIGYRDSILAIGSCFSQHIAARLESSKFKIVCNPTGTLFNPCSIVQSLTDCHQATPINIKDLHRSNELWFHYDFHGDFARPTQSEALHAMNQARQQGQAALRNARFLLITFGTAWVYEHEGRVVANCHKRPASEFTRRRLSVAEIVSSFAPLIEQELKDQIVIFTVSPIRHIGDGLEENTLSKATLRLAIEELDTQFQNVHYFPSFELLMDDLRDYRFYKEDLVHPSEQAIDYVWEKFIDAVLSKEAQQLLPQVEKIVQIAQHRPRNPRSEAHRQLLSKTLNKIEELPEIDFSREIALFRQSLEINL